eukprot:gene4182-4595_t
MNEEEPPVAFIDLPTSDHPSSSSSSSPTPTPPVSPSPPDGGYGWVVVIAAFFVHIFVLGNIYSFGVLYAEYIDAFDSNKAVMAWVGSIGVCIMGALGAWTGKLADRYGNSYIVFLGGALVGLGFLIASFSKEVWHLYVTEGVIAGIGYSFAFVAAVSVVGQWFSSRRGVAVGIAVAGSGVGQFVMSQITRILIADIGWRGTLRVLALINFVGLTLCSLVIRRFLPCVESISSESWIEFFYDWRFCFLYVAIFFNTLGLYMPYTYIPLYAERYGVSSSDGVLILSLVGLSSALGRIALGVSADWLGKLNMLKLCMLASAIATLCWMACKDFASILVYGLIFGFFAGGSVSLIPTVNAELFGIEKLSSIVGTMMTATAVGALLSAPIGGFLYDGTESYFASIALDGTFLFLGFAFTLPVLDSHKNHHHHHHHHHTHDIKDGDHSTDYESLRVDIDLDHPQVNESRNEAKVLLSMEIEENNGIISHSNRSSRSDSSNDNNSDDGVFDEMESVLKEGLDGLVVADRKGHVYEML